jgi:hypothetical protein
MSRLTHGLAAGAVGTTLLNAATYLDMTLTARGASSVPEEDVAKLADRFGISLGEGEDAENRKSAVGALMGLLTGISVGGVYGLVRPWARGVPQSLASIAVCFATMAATDGVTAALGTSDPRTWSAKDWATDIVPHLVFGAGVVLAFDAMDG